MDEGEDSLLNKMYLLHKWFLLEMMIFLIVHLNCIRMSLVYKMSFIR